MPITGKNAVAVAFTAAGGLRRPVRRYPEIVALIASLLAGVAPLAHAKPFVPTDDQQVVQVLPASTRAMRSLRSQLTSSPADLETSLRTARRFIELSRRDGDPRFLGYAQAALSPWWSGDLPAVVLMRATIRQSRHEFQPAAADLRSLTRQTPDDVQAWLTLATVEQVQGNYPAAAQACAQVKRLTRNLIGDACVAEIDSMQGRRDAYPGLRQRYQSDASLDNGTRGWLATLLGEMAQRAGDNDAAESLFADGMRLSPTLYLRGAYADFLLEQQRAEQALRVSRWTDPRADAGASAAQASTDWEAWPDVLLLRHALALQALGRTAELAAPRRELSARFAAARARGELLHGREEARFVLSIEADPARALPLAQQNWTQQKEPADLLVLASAAVAAGRFDLIDQLRTDLASRVETDQRLTALVQTSGRRRP